jgi:hypothetical protein
MLLIKLARLWGWAGDRCLDISEWHKDRARLTSATFWELALVAAGAVLAVVIIVAGVFA